MSRRLLLNQKAPKFSAVDVFGDKISLDHNTEGYTLLVFLRYSGCPWCNLAVHRLSLEYKRLKQNHCNIIAFIQSSKEGVMDNIYQRHSLKPKFPIIADHEMKFYKQYGVEVSPIQSLKSITKIPYWLKSVRELGFTQKKLDGKLFLVPAWYLVNNRTGKVVKLARGVSFYDNDTFVNIYDSLIFKDYPL
jgi:peroxiredoxin